MYCFISLPYYLSWLLLQLVRFDHVMFFGEQGSIPIGRGTLMDGLTGFLALPVPAPPAEAPLPGASSFHSPVRKVVSSWFIRYTS